MITPKVQAEAPLPALPPEEMPLPQTLQASETARPLQGTSEGLTDPRFLSPGPGDPLAGPNEPPGQPQPPPRPEDVPPGPGRPLEDPMAPKPGPPQSPQPEPPTPPTWDADA